MITTIVAIIDSCIKNVLLSLLEVIGYATSW